jgi:carbon-monoxide dehydrogenase large subunit
VISIDKKTYQIKILDYVIVEDAGVMINPLIVDGQIIGGLAQGIGTALLEEMNFDEQGQPMASTLADYCLPGATEVPEPKILHIETPSPYTTFGQKGIGEGGAIGPPAAIANEVNDAIKIYGAEVNNLPITPKRIWTAIDQAKNSTHSLKRNNA